jgi:hypothetical protein
MIYSIEYVDQKNGIVVIEYNDDTTEMRYYKPTGPSSPQYKAPLSHQLFFCTKRLSEENNDYSKNWYQKVAELKITEIKTSNITSADDFIKELIKEGRLEEFFQFCIGSVPKQPMVQ